jgi:ribosomal RNA-processing protein 17
VLPEIKTYEDDGTRIIVTTSEITPEDDDIGPKTVGPVATSYINKNPSSFAKKNNSLGVKKKPQKRTFKSKSKAKKGDKKRGAAKGKRKGREGSSVL